MADDVYDTSMEYIKMSYLKGVTNSLRENSYFQLLAPKLKSQLVNELLQTYHSQFYIFFHDI